jgi:hypothetical protein
MAAQEMSVRLSLPLGVGATGEVERLDGNSIMPRWARVARASRAHTRHVQVLSSWMRGTASSVAETRAGVRNLRDQDPCQEWARCEEVGEGLGLERPWYAAVWVGLWWVWCFWGRALDGVGDVVADVGGGGGRGGGRADEEGTVVGARGGGAGEEGYIEVLRWGGVGGCRHVLLTEG